MFATVEPRDGHELERMITALINATGVVERVIDRTKRPPEADGAAVIALVAEELRRALAVLSEHLSDEELELVTGVLAETTLLVGGHLGLDGYFAGR